MGEGPPSRPLSAVGTARCLAARKALSIPPCDGVVVAADTVVEADGRLLGSPGDIGAAREMIRLQAGRPVSVVTGVVVGREGRWMAGHRLARVEIRPLGDEEIDAYLATGEFVGVAGAVRVEGAGADLIGSVGGCPTALVGLPSCVTARLLRRFGVTAGPAPCCDDPASPAPGT